MPVSMVGMKNLVEKLVCNVQLETFRHARQPAGRMDRLIT